MKISSILALGLTAAALTTAGACGGKASGRLAIGIKDGPPTSSDGRTITKLEIDITRIQLKPDGEGQNEQSGASSNEDKDVVVFDVGTGAARTIDLLKVTTFSELVANVTLPAGTTYDGAAVVVSGARVVFADAPLISVPLVLGGDGNSKAEFEFHFKPAVAVTGNGSTLALIDFVPVVVKDGTGYRLDHDGTNDQSGEAKESDEFEVEGSIATLDPAGNMLTLSGATVGSVDFSAAKFEVQGAEATKAALAVGQKVKVEGTLNKTSGVLIASKLEVE